MTNSQQVASLGEDGVLARILSKLSSQRLPDGVIGPGDDCAVLPESWGRLISTDMMVEDVDFRQSTFTPFDMGWKIAAVNLSDIGAMGGTPRALTISCGLPSDFPVAGVAGIMDGVLSAIAQIAPTCSVVGGDLSQSPQLILAGTVLGSAGPRVITRDGAQPGDKVAIAGPLGLAYLGWQLLDVGCTNPKSQDAITAIAAQRRPQTPVALGTIASATATAMLDVSDGLVQDARRIATASNVAIDLSLSTLSTDIDAAASAAQELGLTEQETHELALRATLSGGEDFALLATFPQQVELPAEFNQIGNVADAGEPGLVTVDGHPERNGGWQHFVA